MKTMRGDGTNSWQPSREHSIEEVPIAIGFLVVTGGDYKGSIFGGMNYERDNDSIVGMAGAIAGARHGASTIRSNWMAQINQANRIDLHPLAHDLTELTIKLQKQQLERVSARQQAFIDLLQ